MEENKEKTQLLGTEPVGKLLMQYAIPAIIAMTASSLYNIIDSIFIGQGVGPLAIAGLGVTFPFMNLAAAFGAMVGVGASALISLRLGQRDYASAQNTLGNVVTLNLILGVAFAAVSLVFLDPILYFFGASPNTIQYARQFMIIILAGNVVTHMYFGLNAVLRAAGHPKQAMYATIGTVVINTALDPVFIYLFRWGIAGAAAATMTAQTLALAWQLKFFANKDELLHLKRGIYRLRRKLVVDILSIGLSPFLMNLCACLIVIVINKALMRYSGDMAIGAYGIINRVAFLFVMVVMGINQGMQPIAGYNFGARQNGRVRQVLRYAVTFATIVMTLGFVVGEAAPWYCARAFTSDTQLIALSVPGMRLMFACFPIIGFQMVTSNFFQSLGFAKISIFLSLTRQLIFLLPALLVFPPLMGVTGVWFANPVSDFLAALVAFLVLRRYLRKLGISRQGNDVPDNVVSVNSSDKSD
jgi:putative MATE family efflux protein